MEVADSLVLLLPLSPLLGGIERANDPWGELLVHLRLRISP